MLSEHSLKKVKAETLCWGISLSREAQVKVLELYPPLFDEVHIHAAHLLIDDRVPVNAVLAEAYSSKSPYLLKWIDQNFVLYRYDVRLCNATIRSAPNWYQKTTSLGTPMSSIFAVHGVRTLALAEYVRCDYINAGKGCQFCSVPIVKTDENRRLVEIGETFEAAFEHNPLYTVALSEGARYTPDRGANYHHKMVSILKKVNPYVSVSVELVPPEYDSYIDLLIDVGVSSLIMNVEFLDPNLRSTLMPAKSQVPISRYYEAWEYAVDKLGWGQVSSVAICGVEDPQNTLTLAEQMVQRGVIPTIMPFRPYDKAPMKERSTTDPALYLWISKEVGDLMKKYRLHPDLQHGCAECGACSLEIDNAREKPMKATSNGWISLETIV